MLVTEKTAEIEAKINSVLERIRPHLQQDGGDVMLDKISDEGIVELKLLGACNTCPLRPMTLRAGIERALMHEIPEIRRIECFN
ncbi:MAG: NifU family protein [Ignavibacteria bacterium]|nr:NifU family protein [Ignavibacteria bacterium]HRE10916.1 NifU family protein [Ignavibacteria bacterium]HRF66700.1 NifU family protein [Ignavibacteria bacterium]